MAQVKFVQRDGVEKNVEIGRDVSVMMAAVRNGVRGIDGECGGCLDCATCHVYVDEVQADLMPPPSDDEVELLSNVAARRKPNSRLSCQLKIPSSIDELIVYVPESQS
jgi:ferredoxin, 2Fe-2S